MMRRLINLWAAVALLGVVAFSVAGTVLWSKGFSSRPEPSHLESSLAMKAYDSSVPKRFEGMKNSLEAKGVNLIEAGGITRSTVPCATPITAAARRSSTAL
jgi:hypothetical protein